MRVFDINDSTWYVFNFDKLLLDDNFDEKSGKIYDAFIEKLNTWTKDIAIMDFISTMPLGNSLTYQIEKTIVEGNKCWLNIVVRNNEVVGVVLASQISGEQIRPKSNDSQLNNIFINDIVINPNYYNMGLGNNILSVFLANPILTDGAGDIDNVYCYINKRNERSKRLFEKNGFIDTNEPKDTLQLFCKQINKQHLNIKL